MPADAASGSHLDEYWTKRDFGKTPEPSGAAAPAPVSDGRLRFVVQRHRARALHYDFRLELDGRLVSWAVPKGPSMDPAHKGLAVKVEDHPIEYADFEGVIPRGEYGGGDVIVWDKGTWAPAKADDPETSIAGGELVFDLEGEKLSGRFVLIRTGKPRAKEQWLLFHKKDAFAVPGWNVDDHPRSVKSGRTNDEVAAAPEAMWRSDAEASEAEVRLGPADAEPGPVFPAPTQDELAALDALGSKGDWEFDGHTLALTNLDKVLFPARGDGPPVTKRDLVRYFACVAPFMVPYLDRRPVNLHRYPNGSEKPGFWHKEAPAYAPKWLTRWRNPDAEPGESEDYFVVDRPAALAWMANYGALELHPWTSLAAEPDTPTWVFFDIDPGTSTTFDEIVVLARLHRTALQHLGVDACAKVTGQRGIQIWVPIVPGPSFSETRAWAETVSRAIGATVPDLVSWSWRKDDRRGLARLDYTQNARNKTLVAPYSTRPAPGAPVSVPIAWDELDDPALRPDGWDIRSVIDRLAERGDPMAPMLTHRQVLPDLS